MEERYYEKDQQDIQGINVTPLVDVSLVLVLIFMVTSPLFEKVLMPVDLPKAASSLAEDRENVTVSISASGEYAVNEVPIAQEALPVVLNQKLKDTGFSFLLIRADERVPHGEVQDLMKTAKALRVKRIAFATEPKGFQ